MGRVYRELPSATELWERFDYKPLTGELVYKVNRYTARIGEVAGSMYSNGYRVLEFMESGVRHRFNAQRVIWKWVYSEDPGAFEVDHINGERSDNRLCNLRLATRSQNRANKRTNPPKGYVKTESGTFHARIAPLGQRQIILGNYATEAEARAAYIKASQELHGSFSPYSK